MINTFREALGTENITTTNKTKEIMPTLALTQPIYTAVVERAFSPQNLIKTKLRNRISHYKTDILMRVMLHRPGLCTYDFIGGIKGLEGKEI